VVHSASTVLGSFGGQVVRSRVGGDTQRLPGAAFDDARCTTHQGNLTLDKYVARWVHEFISLF